MRSKLFAFMAIGLLLCAVCATPPTVAKTVDLTEQFDVASLEQSAEAMQVVPAMEVAILSRGVVVPICLAVDVGIPAPVELLQTLPDKSYHEKFNRMKNSK